MNEDIKALRGLLKAGKEGRSTLFNPSQLERVLDDAERYQWLRENVDSGVKIEIGCLEEGRATIDDSIDQARKA